MSSPRKRKQLTPVYEYTFSPHTDPMIVVYGLLDGVDIILVDPLFYPQLKQPLTHFRDQYEDKGDTKLVKKIDFLIDYIDKYPERQMISEKLMGRPKTARVKPPPFTKEELENQVQSILENGISRDYSYDEYQQIIGEMRNRKTMYTENQDFEEADRYEEKLRQLISTSESHRAIEMTRETIDDIKRKVDDAEKSYKDAKSRWEKVIENFEREKKRSLESLQQEQDEEYQREAEKLEQKKPKTLPTASQQLLDLKRMEKLLVMSKRFAEAGQLNKKITVFEENEQYELREKWVKSNKITLNQLCKKQDQIYAIKVANLQRDENKLKRDMKKEMHALKHRVDALNLLLQKNEQSIEEMDQTATARTTTSETAGLPPIKMPKKTVESGPRTFRQRALINMKIYTHVPPKTARTGR